MTDIMKGISPLPVCAITGRIAGDFMACGDCDPCIFGASAVLQVVKNLMAERDEFASKYANEAGENDIIRQLYPELVEALEMHEQQYQRGILNSTTRQLDDVVAVRRAILAKCKAGA